MIASRYINNHAKNVTQGISVKHGLSWLVWVISNVIETSNNLLWCLFCGLLYFCGYLTHRYLLCYIMVDSIFKSLKSLEVFKTEFRYIRAPRGRLFQSNGRMSGSYEKRPYTGKPVRGLLRLSRKSDCEDKTKVVKLNMEKKK